MSNQNSAKAISIIALIISIIALLLGLYTWNYSRTHCCFQDEEPQPAQQEHVQQPQAQAQAETPATEPQVRYEEEQPGEIVVKDRPVKKQAATAPFIDLGLPSGTKWRTLNEEGDMLAFYDAVAKYGNQLPTQKQFNELYEKCQWKELKDGGYKAIGPNGKFIIFPFTGYINCQGEFRSENSVGDYWTSTPNSGTNEAYHVAMYKTKGVKIALHERCYQRAIRLVEK